MHSPRYYEKIAAVLRNVRQEATPRKIRESPESDQTISGKHHAISPQITRKAHCLFPETAD